MTPALLVTARGPADWLGVDMAETTCSVDGCATAVRARGWCMRHYQIWRRYGTPTPTKEPRPTCSISGCSFPAKARGWCNPHYQRWFKTGDPLIKPKVKSPGWKTPQGYIMLTGHLRHPIASVSGYILEHRLVLWEAIGPGEHPCHWCGETVTWDVRTPGSPGCLTVDHLDRVRDNNARDNLVPSCIKCNVGRGLRGKKRRPKPVTCPNCQCSWSDLPA